MITPRLEEKSTIDLRTCSIDQFKDSAKSPVAKDLLLNFLKCALEAKEDSAEKVEYVVEVLMHNKKLMTKAEKMKIGREKLREHSSPQGWYSLTPLDDILKGSVIKNVIERLKSYREKIEKKHAIDLLIADFYIQINSYENAYETIKALLNPSCYQFHDYNVELITDLILAIGKWDKTKAQQLLNEQLKLELVAQGLRLTQVNYITRAFRSLDVFDEKAQQTLLPYYQHLQSTIDRKTSDYDCNFLRISLVYLSKFIATDKQTQLQELLFKQYELDLRLRKTYEISFQLLFDELVKSNYFKTISTDNLQILLNTISEDHSFEQCQKLKEVIVDPSHLKMIEHVFAKMHLRNYYFEPNISTELLKIMLGIAVMSDPGLNRVIEVVSALQSKQCFNESMQHDLLLYYKNQVNKYYENTALTKALIDAKSWVSESERPLLLNLIYETYFCRLTKEIDRFYSSHASSSSYDSLVSHLEEIFAELIKNDYFNKMPEQDFERLVKSIAEKQKEYVKLDVVVSNCLISQLETLQKTKDASRLNIVNKALLQVHLNIETLPHIEKAIKLANEVKQEAKEYSVCMKYLADKIQTHKPAVAVEILLKLAKDDIDSLFKAAMISEKLQISQAIELYGVAIKNAIKTKDTNVIGRNAIGAMRKLFQLLTAKDAALEETQIAKIKESIMFGFKAIFQDPSLLANNGHLCKNLVLGYLTKSRPFVDFSELFDLLHSEFGFDKWFQDLACEYFPKESPKYIEYNSLREKAEFSLYKIEQLSSLEVSSSKTDYPSIAKLISGLKEIFSDYLTSQNVKLFQQSDFFHRVKKPLGACINKIIEKNKEYEKMDVSSNFPLIFSSEVDNLGVLGDVFRELYENSYSQGIRFGYEYWSCRFQFYYYMYHSVKDKNTSGVIRIVSYINLAMEEMLKLIKLKYEYRFTSFNVEKDIYKYINLITELSMNDIFEKTAKSLITNLNYELCSNLEEKEDKQRAKEFARHSHLPAIAYLINRKWIRAKVHQKLVKENPGFDYLCVVMMILMKEPKVKPNQKILEAYKKAEQRIQELTIKYGKKYLSLIEAAPKDCKNVHVYLAENVSETDALYKHFNNGMKQALGFDGKDAEWLAWKNFLLRHAKPVQPAVKEVKEVKAPTASPAPVLPLTTDDEPVVIHKTLKSLPVPSAPEAVEESKAKAVAVSLPLPVAEPLTTDAEPTVGSKTVEPSPEPSAPPMLDDEEQPGLILPSVKNPSVMFQPKAIVVSEKPMIKAEVVAVI